MPYVARGKCVYKKTTGKKVGCTKGSVKKYLAALHANAESTKPSLFKEYFMRTLAGDQIAGDTQDSNAESEYADGQDNTTPSSQSLISDCTLVNQKTGKTIKVDKWYIDQIKDNIAKG